MLTPLTTTPAITYDGGTAPLILNLGTRLTCVVSSTSRPLYHPGAGDIHWVGPRAGLDSVAKKMPLLEIDTRPSGRTARIWYPAHATDLLPRKEHPHPFDRRLSSLKKRSGCDGNFAWAVTQTSQLLSLLICSDIVFKTCIQHRLNHKGLCVWG